jgi:hypothetical protein
MHHVAVSDFSRDARALIFKIGDNLRICAQSRQQRSPARFDHSQTRSRWYRERFDHAGADAEFIKRVDMGPTLIDSTCDPDKSPITTRANMI